MLVACLDLEGVLVPEIWINVAERTGIDDLRLTTRDIADYDELMTHRLRVLDRHGIRLSQIQEVIAGMGPLPGAAAYAVAVNQEVLSGTGTGGRALGILNTAGILTATAFTAAATIATTPAA